ncbi:VWA domain-containing protein [Xanthobacter sp. KR7-225]|uniref:VWA domain-containing protein n=1 Tax=Xanthobacter sp. KR7-225 TaxID=3156613 RepID=UPI0032B5272B
MIAFEWLWAFALLPLPLLARGLMPRARQTRSGALRVPFFRDLAEAGLATPGARRGKALRLLLLTLVWALLVTAAARPAYRGQPMPVPVAGRDLMMAVDLSGSMARDDLSLDGILLSDRLSVVKSVVDEFVARRTGDRVGLILFGSRAYVQAPLTFDRKVVRELLASASIGLAGPETAIGDAVALAVKTLRDRPEGQRVLILLTDGASNSGMLGPLDAAELARQAGVKIYTIGVGADRLPGGLGFGQRIVNPSADLDEATLAKIAALTGGRYFRARDGRGLAAIYDDIERMEPVTGDPLFLTPTVSLFQWPLGLALVLSLAFAVALARPRFAARPAAEAAPPAGEGARP